VGNKNPTGGGADANDPNFSRAAKFAESVADLTGSESGKFLGPRNQFWLNEKAGSPQSVVGEALVARPGNSQRRTYQTAKMPLDANELAGLLRKVADKKFGPGQCTIKASGQELTIEGDRNIVTWLDGVLQKLNEK
jgi:hypothetical protein